MNFIVSNIIWFALVATFYALFPAWREVLPGATIAVILWRIQEVARFRPNYSWLEKWPWLLKLEKGKLTGYHLSGGGALLVMFVLTPPELTRFEFFWQGVLLIALLGYTSNQFYHVDLMYPHRREYDKLLHGLVPNRIRKMWGR